MLLHVRKRDGCGDGFVQLYDHLIGQIGGAGKGEPGVVQKLGVAELAKGWQIRKIRYSFSRSNGNAEQRICMQEA